MQFEHVINAVGVAIQAGIPVLLTGPVGDAKTSIVEDCFKTLCDERHTAIVALHDPPQFGGYPVPRDNGVALLPTDWVLRLAGAKKRAGLFLDEFSNGAPATRSAAMRGVLDGTWGDATIPLLSTVAAMNPAEISESGYELSAPLSNRFIHIDWDMPVPYWVEQLVSGFPAVKITTVPDDWRKTTLPKATTYLAAFGNSNPGAIKQMPNDAAARQHAFPTLRSFTNARDCVAACEAAGLDLEHEVTVLLVRGCVGPGAAKEFLNYANELDLPDPEELLKHPKTLQLPARGDRCFAVLTAVVSAVLANNTVERWSAAWDVLSRAVDMDRADVAATSARSLAHQPPKGAKLPQAIDAFIPVLRDAGLLQNVS